MNDDDIATIYGDAFLELWTRVRPFSMVSPERAFATYNACSHVVKNGIVGDFVECGVYRGGMAMLAALTFQSLGATDRHIWLFDTFAGMSAPTDVDQDRQGVSAAEQLAADPSMCAAGLDEVRSNLDTLGYHHLHFVVGDVVQTLELKQNIPDKIAVLRLDTDWYDSTRAELNALYPRVSERGVVLVDDYGHWLGARKALDEFVAASRVPLFVSRTDTTGVEFIKPSLLLKERFFGS